MYLDIILLAFALSIDATIVSFSYGLTFRENRLKNALMLAVCTGVFQGIMPAFGYFLTGFIKSYIEHYSEIVVFIIFTYLGIKIIKESFEEKKEKNLCIDLKCLLLVGIATSIDAFSAGISLSLWGCRILKPVLLISFVTFADSLTGFGLGGKLKDFPTKGLEILAGVLLILLGIKAFI